MGFFVAVLFVISLFVCLLLLVRRVSSENKEEGEDAISFLKKEAFSGNRIAIYLLKNDCKLRSSRLDIAVEAVKGNPYAQEILDIPLNEKK